MSARRAPWSSAARAAAALALAGAMALPAPASARRTFTGENGLDVPRPLMKTTQEGLEMIYRREYAEALRLFGGIAREHPDNPVGPLGRSLVYQSMMLENYDFAWDDTYAVEHDRAYAAVSRALKSTAAKAWNYFLYAAIVGIDGIHDVRRGEYLRAFNKGWDAVEAMKRAKRLDAGFRDPDLGVGIYNYWRTAITRQVPSLPRFGDHRPEGISQMSAARQGGFLVWAAAGFALGLTYWEDKRLDEAIAECLKLQREYPESVVNTMLLGRIYADADRFEDALAQYRDIQARSPENTRVQFLVGDAWFKSKRDDAQAEQAFHAYLRTRPSPDFQAHTWYRLGQIRERARDLDGAIGSYNMALSLRPKYPACEKRLKAVVAAKQRKLEAADGGGSGAARPRRATP